ncbi:hypothetical protein LV779_23660 [Streptomyces thinghirensis]|nr:hypothetical protein [Streptomyces thinghirensis]
MKRLAADRSHSEVLIIEGDPGAGKSVLLDLAMKPTRRAGHRVLRAVGSESEAHLAYAGLHQLLRPVLGDLDGLPARRRSSPGSPWDWPNRPKPPSPRCHARRPGGADPGVGSGGTGTAARGGRRRPVDRRARRWTFSRSWPGAWTASP